MNNLFACDIETTGLDSFSDNILGIGVYSPDAQYYFEDVQDFGDWVRDRDCRLIFHNGSFDINFLRRAGLDIRHLFTYDTKSIATTLCPRPRQATGQKSRYGLENLNLVLLGGAEYKLDRTDMTQYSTQEVRDYCLEDCKLTYELFQYLKENVPSWTFVESWIMPATRLLADVEYNGLRVDVDGLTGFRGRVEDAKARANDELLETTAEARAAYRGIKQKELREKYRKMCDAALVKSKNPAKTAARYDKLFNTAMSKADFSFNFSSPTQLTWMLRDYYGLDITRSYDGKESTGEDVLVGLDHPAIKSLLKYRETSKLLTQSIPNLLDNIATDGNIHARFNIGGARTGRLSVQSPNLQQVPRGEIRQYIVARPGHLLCTVDYSQIEVRLMAEAAQETELINAFKDGLDPYSVIAKKLFKLDEDVRVIKTERPDYRNAAKTVGLSILYGTGANKLKDTVKRMLNLDLNRTECIQYIKDYRNSLPNITAFKEALEYELANQKVFYNLVGRPFIIEDNNDLYMKAFNTFIQGSASDLVIHAQAVHVAPYLKDAVYRSFIHDECIIELPEDTAQEQIDRVIIPGMTRAVTDEFKFKTPLAVEYELAREWSKP